MRVYAPDVSSAIHHTDAEDAAGAVGAADRIRASTRDVAGATEHSVFSAGSDWSRSSETG